MANGVFTFDWNETATQPNTRAEPQAAAQADETASPADERPCAARDKYIPHAFVPTAGACEWWTGDPQSLPYLDPSEEHPYIITRRNLLSEEQCAVLIACFERNREKFNHEHETEFWKGRYIWQNGLSGADNLDAMRILQQARLVTQNALTQFFTPSEPLYSDTAQVVRWHPGLALNAHVDNIEPDGRPNGTPHRTYSSIIYLNDEYEGGETFFPGHGVRVKPERGLLIAFGAGPDYAHGVSKVTKGLRYTYAGWFTHDKSWEDAHAMLVF